MKEPLHVVRAQVFGFCTGVKRALQMAEKALDDPTSGMVYTLGDLVHNDAVMNALRGKGIQTIHSVDEISGGTVVIRAHGVAPETLRALSERNIAVIDATCPKVKKSHKIIEEHSAAGFHIVIAGERDHSEVRGLVARAASCSVVQTGGEVAQIPCSGPILLLAQTTFNLVEYRNIRTALEERCDQVKVFDTICPAMERRYEAVSDLCDDVEAVIVIGGKNSANTRRLYEKATESGLPCWHIEQSGEIPEDIYRYERVGLTAGASTPDWIVDEVERRLTERARGDDD